MASPSSCHAAPVRRLAVAVLAALLGGGSLAACSAGPSDRPAVAVVETGLAPPPDAPPAATAPLPALQAPVAELPWADCTASTLTKLALTPRQPGLILECATLAVPLDPQLAGKLTIGLVRARIPATPRDAAPLVLTTGAEQPSTTALATLAASGSADVLTTRPLVAIDRRGVGSSSPVSCLTPGQRAAIENVDPAAPAPADPLAATLQLGRDATQACTDVISPAELGFDTTHAAADLDALRLAWKVDRLALLGLGDGAAVVLRYAVAHPQQVSRLVLDSPATPGADEVSAAKDRARGADAAFTAFATNCAATASCPVGADPLRTVTELMQRARSTGGLPAAAGRRASAGAVLAAVRQALLTPAGAQRLAPALASAVAGDATALLTYLDQATGAASGDNAGTQLDAEFVARCSDAAARPTPQQVSTLVAQWRKDSPLFGADTAARLLLCLSWPTPSTAPPVRNLGAVPPALLLSATSDPVTGTTGTPAAVTDIQQAGGDATVLSWQNAGHPVFLSSACARSAVSAYIGDGARPQEGTICPP